MVFGLIIQSILTLCVMLETLEKIDGIQLFFSNQNRIWLNITIAFIMFGVALELHVGDFRQLLKRPRAAFVGILSQFVLLPLFTFFLVYLFRNNITLTVGLGMILVASCPGGNVSNFISALAKGNIALSVSLTAFSSIAGLFLTPVLFAYWGNLFVTYYYEANGSELLRPLHVDPWNIFSTILLILGIPILLGLSFRVKFPDMTKKILPTIKRLSILTFASMVIFIFIKNYELFLEYVFYIFLLVLLHNAIALGIGYFSGRVFRLPKRDCKTISIETGIQNSGLALALLFDPLVFPEDMAVGGMTFIAAWWGVWHIVAGLAVAGAWSGFSVKSE